jgi:hypothetical protein
VQPDFVNDEMDMADDGLYVNFSADEAASESRDVEPLPTGKYLMNITEVELREVKNNDKGNLGKPMYSFEFTVVKDLRAGIYVKRTAYALAMLFPPALFTITHIMKATGFPVAEGRVRIPKPAEFHGKLLVVGGTLRPEQKDKNDPSKTYAPRFEPRFFAPASEWARFEKGGAGTAAGRPSASGAATSLLS